MMIPSVPRVPDSGQGIRIRLPQIGLTMDEPGPEETVWPQPPNASGRSGSGRGDLTTPLTGFKHLL